MSDTTTPQTPSDWSTDAGLVAYNRQAWDDAVKNRSQWTIPVTGDEVAAARRGKWSIQLTVGRPVPREWFPPLAGCELLLLAGGGGQQGPIMAAAGAHVTVFDNSPKQLAQDRYVAGREDLTIATVQGDMRDLAVFADERFDLIIHPTSNLFIPDVNPVWREAFRVLKPGGILLAGFANPVFYLFDNQLLDKEGIMQVRHKIPYSDVTSLTDEERAPYVNANQPLEFGHTLEDQLGGQMRAGFHLTGLIEDRWPDAVLDSYIPTFMATRAVKPRANG